MNEKLLDDFVSDLTKDKIKTFNKMAREKLIEIKSISKEQREENKFKLSKYSFINIMTNIFSDKYDKIYEHLYKRFQNIKYDIKLDRIKNNNLMSENEKDCFFITNIINDEKELDVYEITVALILFTNYDFKEKMHLLFHITDVDGDEFINQNELKNIINTSHHIFADEENSSKSSIVNQSVANIKANQIIENILYHPGLLFNIIKHEKYFTFIELYNAIEKIYNYKYVVLPSFIY